MQQKRRVTGCSMFVLCCVVLCFGTGFYRVYTSLECLVWHKQASNLESFCLFFCGARIIIHTIMPRFLLSFKSFPLTLCSFLYSLKQEEKKSFQFWNFSFRNFFFCSYWSWSLGRWCRGYPRSGGHITFLYSLGTIKLWQPHPFPVDVLRPYGH